MIEITLPDGSKRPFEHPVTVQDVAASIGAGLAKATLAGKVDDHLVDASFLPLLATFPVWIQSPPYTIRSKYYSRMIDGSSFSTSFRR